VWKGGNTSISWREITGVQFVVCCRCCVQINVHFFVDRDLRNSLWPLMLSAQCASPPPICLGHLTKLGHVLKNWKKRFFVLEMGRLTYFEKPSGKDVPPYGVSQKGCMVLTNVQLQESVQEGERNSEVLNQIYLVHEDSGKDLLLSAADYQDAQRWKDALQAHILFATVHSDMTYSDRDTEVEEKAKLRRASLLQTTDGRTSSHDIRLSGEKDPSEQALIIPQIIGSAEKITVRPTAGFVIKTRRESGIKVNPPSFNLLLLTLVCTGVHQCL
jgi:hypothetical protein